MDTLTVLIEARKLIEKPENWFQGLYHAGPAHCSLGAIIEASRPLAQPHAGAVDALVRAIDRPIITRWNDADKRTHPEILAAFDKAIAAERAKLMAKVLPDEIPADEMVLA